MTETCTVKGCNADRANGDLLFCTRCRKKWQEVCKGQGILEQQVPQSDLDDFVKQYQTEGFGWKV